MKQCTSCGAVNAPEAPACVQCGSVNFVPMAGQPMYQQPPMGGAPMGGAPMYQQPAPQPPKKSNTGLIVGICVGVVVLAIVAIVLVLVLGKKDKDDDDKETTAVAVTTTEDDDWGNNPILPGVDEDDPTTTEDMGWDDPTTQGGGTSGLTLESIFTDDLRKQLDEECRQQVQNNPEFSDVGYDISGNTLTYIFTYSGNIGQDQIDAFVEKADAELKPGMDAVVDSFTDAGISGVVVEVVFKNNDGSEIYHGYFFGTK